mmetsp:Transcript_22626/g.31544  ORF Transcript_22626/g.31544 Transcript_22626/m.31544 type:complete len:328 (+) Transcript_22626:165-1148(+)|eukprot:CAMPEP_0196594264 /NCGR_PEP_ID=MMETSP1081-20130531/77816_1 /TAXON_ID=36882 /ORGANISM="Pyramimonas amylifera, Strain CCMP720" /LENGTH=327 /DNA_ID=CAMNT_0041918475 /DNA_START=161 /DNA_END=1144 /DNA_ORIENTATION=+
MSGSTQSGSVGKGGVPKGTILYPEPDLHDLIPGSSAHYLPRYLMPNISSILPEYSNSEQDCINHAFNQGNFNTLNTLPDHLRCHEVNKARSSQLEQVRRPAPSGTIPAQRTTNDKGLFQEYEFIPSRYNLEDILEQRSKVEAKEKEKLISSKGWQDPGYIHKAPYEDGFVEGQFYPHSSDPYEAAQDMILRHRWMEDQQILEGAWKPPGTTKAIHEPAGYLMAHEIIQQLHKIITEDWEGVVVNIYENQDAHWVIRFNLNSVDSEQGLVTYMNVFLRCNKLVTKYDVTRVTEQWNVKPGDGSIYFTLRPPWVTKKLTEDVYVPPCQS